MKKIFMLYKWWILPPFILFVILILFFLLLSLFGSKSPFIYAIF